MIANAAGTLTPERLDILEESVTIPAPGGALPGVLAYPLAAAAQQAALVVGPHPLMGGRLDNNVVRGVARGLAEHGLATLRFAYGGAGPTPEGMDAFWRTGHAPEDSARESDARAALAFLQGTIPQPVVLIGYSFGTSLLAGLISACSARHAVLIGPTLAQHAHTALQHASAARLLITADNDFATPLTVTRAWFNQCTGAKRLVVIPAAEHFYVGAEERLVREIHAWIQP